MLNKQELGTVLRRIGERMSDKELKDMVDEVEVNAIITIFTTITITITVIIPDHRLMQTKVAQSTLMNLF